MKTQICHASLSWIALLFIGAITLPWSPACAADEITIIEPAAGSSYRVGDVMRITIEMAADAPWGTQVFDLSTNSGINIFSTGIILDDTVREKKHYDWIIPDEFSQRGEFYSPVSDACRIMIFPYQKDSSTPYGSTGNSEVFAIEPASAIRMARESAWSPARAAELHAAMFSSLDASLPAHDALPAFSPVYSINGRLLTAMSGIERMPGVQLLLAKPDAAR